MKSTLANIPNSLTPMQVSRWLRDRGRRFISMADEIDATFGLLTEPLIDHRENTSSGATSVPAEERHRLKERIRQLLIDRSMRLKDIAAAVDTTPQLLKPFLKENNGFTQKGRGWYTVLKEQTEEKVGYDED